MGSRLRRHVASALWYFGLPVALSVGALVVLDDGGAIEGGVAPWHLLLAFALFELLAVIARDALGEARRREETRPEPEGHATPRSRGIRDYLEILGMAVAVALVFRAFVVEPFKIPTGSMIPTLQVGDHIFVDKFVYGLHIPFLRRPVVRGRVPRRGEVIVFMYPRDPSKDFIKRVIGVPGDVVEVHDDRVLVNGRPLPRCLVGTERYADVDPESGETVQRSGSLYVEFVGGDEHEPAVPYLTLFDRGLSRRAERPPYRVGSGELFAMGDNRDYSRDSRTWGAVPLDYVKGRAHWIWWTLTGAGGSRFDRIGHDILGRPDVPLELRASLTRCIARGPTSHEGDFATRE